MFPVVFYRLTWLFFFLMSVGPENEQLLTDVNTSFLLSFPGLPSE